MTKYTSLKLTLAILFASLSTNSKDQYYSRLQGDRLNIGNDLIAPKLIWNKGSLSAHT